VSKPVLVRVIASMIVALGIVSLLMRMFAGRELTLVPWPVALIVLLLGLFVLQQTYEHPRNRIARERDAQHAKDWTKHA